MWYEVSLQYQRPRRRRRDARPRSAVIIGLFFLLIVGCLQAFGEPLRQPGLFHPPPQRQQLVQQHFQLGVQRAREGLLQEAIDHLKYCVGLDPLFVDAYYILGLVYYHIGLSHLRETDYAMSKVLELQPGHVDALVYRSLTRMRLGAFAAAESDFKTILSLAPETLPIRRDLANAYLRQGSPLTGKSLMRILTIWWHAGISVWPMRNKAGIPQNCLSAIVFPCRRMEPAPHRYTSPMLPKRLGLPPSAADVEVPGGIMIAMGMPISLRLASGTRITCTAITATAPSPMSRWRPA
jgi:hypothetical protein